MPVPLLDLNIQNLALENELKATFERVLRSGQFILGPEVEGLEGKLAEMLGVRHSIGVSSGTDAILLALMTLGIGPGDEVICPSFTFFATAGCVARVGAKPVFVDSCSSCFNLLPGDVSRKITSRTKAIMPVHLFGQAASMDEILDLARADEIPVIEDAAQSLGAEYRRLPVGGLGTFGTFSFFPSKNLSGFGDGGLVVTNDDELAAKARSLRAHGAKPKYYHKYVGGNFRLDPLQAALLAVKLPRYRDYTEKRRANAAYYTERLTRLPGVSIADGVGQACQDGGSGDGRPGTGIVLPAIHDQRTHIWNQYTIRVIGEGQRDVLRSGLARMRIGTEVYYPIPLHQQECFAYVQPRETLPWAERLSRECLSLPIYPELTVAQKNEVTDAVAELMGASLAGREKSQTASRDGGLFERR